jgi:chromate transporter
MTRLLELARLFLKLGTIGFGGPAVHIGLMDREIVERRAWMSREQFLDLVGVTNLIPGPNSTEMAILVGYRRAGFLGLLVAGLSFIVPAAVITGILAHLYVEYRSLPQVEPLVRGITPAVLAVIVGALWRLGRAALKTRTLMVIGAGVAVASWAGCDQVLTLVVGSLLGAILLGLVMRRGTPGSTAAAAVTGAFFPPIAKAAAVTAASAGAGAASATAAAVVPLWKLGLLFLKVGAVLYGGGYVLIAYLDGDLVRGYGWLSEQQLLDAIAVGQFTPGPILSTATFVGYILLGVPGAMVATLAIFLPSFVFVILVNPWVSRLRSWRWTSLVLDAVNAASIGLMAAATYLLGKTALGDWRSGLIAGVAIVVTARWRIAPAWLVLAGALAGRLLFS